MLYLASNKGTIKIAKGVWISPGKEYTAEHFKNVDIDSLIKKQLICPIDTENSAPPEVKEPRKPGLKNRFHKSKWILDPEGLKDKHIDMLNILVQERDPEQAPYETPEEAIAKLSQHFVPST